MENFRDFGGKPWKKEVKARPGEGQTLKQLRDFIKEMMEACLGQSVYLHLGSGSTE